LFFRYFFDFGTIFLKPGLRAHSVAAPESLG
jgi:hypothetical protein